MTRKTETVPMQKGQTNGRDAASSYADKIETYFAGVRHDFLARLPERPRAAILEIGCGFGHTGATALAEGKCATYAGVELFPEAAEAARTHLTEVIAGDVETVELPWRPAQFDAVLMSEVLEHLADPWAVLARVVRLLKPGALVMASSPNVAHSRIVAELIRGRWDLTDSGPMDRTHLRWFTPTSYRAMFEDAGIQVESVGPMAAAGPRARLFNALTGGRFQHLTMRQICIVGYRA